MKAVKKIGVSSVGFISAARNAEASLARRDVTEMEHGLPDGHPLKEDIEKQKALIGDLSGLPPGHPLLVQMQAARDRYTQLQDQKDGEQNKAKEVRKIKKIDAAKAAREARRIEEAQNASITAASKGINEVLDRTLADVRDLYKVISEHEELLNKDYICRSKIVRMKRLLFASERGLSECRMAQVRT